MSLCKLSYINICIDQKSLIEALIPNDREVQGIFMGLKFWPKGILGVFERCQDFFWLQKINKGIFFGREGFVFFISSNQQ